MERWRDRFLSIHTILRKCIVDQNQLSAASSKTQSDNYQITVPIKLSHMQKIGIHFIYILFLSFITLGCHTEGKHTHEDVTTLEEEAHSNAQHTESHTDIISVTREQFEASGFKTGSLEMKPFNTTLITNGRIHLPEKNQAIASSLIGGTVNDIDLIHGI